MRLRSTLLVCAGMAAGAGIALGVLHLLPGADAPTPAVQYGASLMPVQVPQGAYISFEEEKNDFILFLHKFSTDTTYQFAHVEWPLMKLGLSSDFDIETTWVDSNHWRFSEVAYCRNYMPLVHTSFQRAYINTGERIISWHGKETGENFSYYFKRSAHGWRLVRYEDFGG